MRDDVRDALGQSFPAEYVVAPPAGELWARGRVQRHRRTVAQAVGATASVVALIGLGVVYGLPHAVSGPTPSPQIGSDDIPTEDAGPDDGTADDTDRAHEPRWEVCDYADRANAQTDGTSTWERNIATACEQVRTGQQPDRPDIVACYRRSDEPGGSLAGDIATETCDRLAERDQAIPLEEVDDLARSRSHADREAALTTWEPTGPPPDAVQLLAGEPGELAWYVDGDTDGVDHASSLAFGVAAWDDRLGDDADAVCAWLVDEIAAVIDDGRESLTNEPDAPTQYAYAEPEHNAVSVVLDSILEGTTGDGLAPIIVERCGP